MSHTVRMLERQIRAAEADRASCQQRVVDITAYIRALREALENEDTPTQPDVLGVLNGGTRR